MVDNKKKEKTVEELISDYQGMHGKSFKDRIKKFEEFNDPDKAHGLRLQYHADYVVMGKPSDRKKFPGAYESAYKVLDKTVSNDTDKVNDLGQLTKVLEAYVDTFLHHAVGKRFKEMMDAAKEEGLSKKEIRNLKSQLFRRYHIDEKGNEMVEDIFSEQYINNLKGKKKIYLVGALKDLAQKSVKGYTLHLDRKARQHLINEDDILNLHKYLTPKFKKAGFEHKDHILTKNPRLIAHEYAALLTGGDLRELGYKRIKKKEEK